MGSLTALGLVLLILMIIVGGKQGISSFLSMVVNFGILFFSIVLIAFHMPPIIVTVVASVILLSITIFWSSASDNASTTAFQASVLILIVLIAIIIPIEYWARVGGFGLEDSEELEGLSLYVGINFTKLAICTAILSSLGGRLPKRRLRLPPDWMKLPPNTQKFRLINCLPMAFLLVSRLSGRRSIRCSLVSLGVQWGCSFGFMVSTIRWVIF